MTEPGNDGEETVPANPPHDARRYNSPSRIGGTKARPVSQGK